MRVVELLYPYGAAAELLGIACVNVVPRCLTADRWALHGVGLWLGEAAAAITHLGAKWVRLWSK
jgi:hypothetical protein